MVGPHFDGGFMAVRTVLVVDDDLAIRDTLGEVLRAEGYRVSVAENGLIALEIMRSLQRPDVVVLDLMMPILSGWEVLEQLETDASIRDIPVLVVSAMAAPRTVSSEPGGVRMSLPKPPDIDALLEAIEQVALPQVPRPIEERGAAANPTR
jgi:two-component system response regulator CpxR